MTQNKMILTDGFGRKHNYLRISLTEKCNLRCTYCMPAEGILLSPKKDLMTADEIFAIARVFVDNGVDKMRLTGGEPLLRKDFPEIITKLSELKTEISITTNGVFIDKHIELLKQFKVLKINLSLDTLVSSKFHSITLRNQFESVINNLHLLLENNFKIKVNVVLIKGFNDNEIIDFIKLTQFLPISIRFIEFMPFAGNKWDKSKLVSYAEILDQAYSHFLSTDIEKLEDEKNYTARAFKIKNYAGSFAIISSITNPFCDVCNRIRITANGKIKNCLFSNVETDLLTAFRNGESIEELIENGMTTFEDINNPVLNSDNRSMISIGG
jgi:molybdenum cofactor biosynthesis protein A